MENKNYDLKVWVSGDFFTKDGTYYHKIMFLTCPIVETNKRLMKKSGLNIHDGIGFHISLTDKQILRFRDNLERLIKTLKIKPKASL